MKIKSLKVKSFALQLLPSTLLSLDDSVVTISSTLHPSMAPHVSSYKFTYQDRSSKCSDTTILNTCSTSTHNQLFYIQQS